MSKALLVAQREYLENIRTKGFWFSTLFMPFVFAAAMIVPIWFEANKDAKTYAVVDASGWLGEAVAQRVLRDDLTALCARAARVPALFPEPVAALAAAWGALDEAARPALIDAVAGGSVDPTLPEQARAAAETHAVAVRAWWETQTPERVRGLVPDASKRRFVRIDPADTTTDALNKRILEEDLFAYFLIGADPTEDGAGCRYASANLTDTSLQEWYAGLASEEVRRKRLAREEIPEATAAWISAALDFESRLISAEGDEAAQESDAMAQWAPVAFVYLLWLSVFMVAMMMLTSTVTEKSNRLVEVLLSSITAMDLMAGKILGIAATGLTTVGAWLVSFLTLVHFVPVLMGTQPEFSLAAIASDPVYLVSFVVYFTLGYLFYGALLVGLGSVCDNLKDAQNMASPVTLTLFVPMMLMVPIGQDPNGTLAKIFSYLPPLTPFVMMNRAAGPPTTLEYILTTLLMVVSVVAALWVAAKVFRVGILLSGKPPKLRELWRYIRTPG